MRKRRTIVVAGCMAGCIAQFACAQTQSAIDPEETRQVLVMLLSAGDALIPAKSTCYGNYAQAGKPRLNDLLGMQLAYLYRGENVIAGSCRDDKEKHCLLSVTHRFGEDVSSMEIRFVVAKGKVNIASLDCVITP